MTPDQYLKCLKKLGLTRASIHTVAATGMSMRQCIRIAKGDDRVPPPLAKLLRLAIRHGITAQELAEL